MAGLLSLATALSSNINKRTSSVSLAPLDPKDAPAADMQELRFQYFPETIQDSKRVNYVAKDIPGGSLPIYQWSSSGERILAFTSIFTTDVDLSAVTGIDKRLKAAGVQGRNVDVRSAVIWLRSFCLPQYGQASQVGTPITTAPRKAILSLPGTGIGLAGGEQLVNDDELVVIMTQCDVTWDSFFPSGLPRQATVQLAFAQVAQYQGQVTFPQYGTRMSQAVSSSGGPIYFGYSLVPTQPAAPAKPSTGA
jgi:hypothetical protein